MICGRKSELSRIKNLIKLLKEGNKGTVLIEGEKGMGKTTLVENAVAQEEDIEIFRVNFLPDRKNVPLSGFYDIPGVRETILSDKEAFFGEIFLINNYGILIAHESNIESDMDEDILGSMLTAVQEFVKDSFGGEGGLGKLEYGEKKILIEHGKNSFMAAVIVGEEHPGMRGDMIKALEEIEEKMGDIFLDWDGDVEKIAGAVPLLRKLTDKRYLVRKSLEDMNLHSEQMKILERLLGVMARKSGPRIIIMEDLHWADEFSLLALKYLSRNLENSLILATYRKSGMEKRWIKFLDSVNAERMSLAPLKSEEIREIITNAFYPSAFSDDFLEKIVADSGGNPFYAHEILLSFKESGIIYRDEGVWKNSEEEARMPKTISELISWRLDHLERNELNVVELLAAAVGTDIETLRYAVGVDGDFLADILKSLEEKDILVREGNEVRFYHSGVREVVYEEMSQRWRLTTHRKLGEVIEERTRGEGDAVYHLAYHFSRSLDREKGIRYSCLAGERASASYAAHEAIGYYEVALSIIEGYIPRHPAKNEVLERLGELYSHTGEYDKALRSFENVLRSCEKPRRIYRKIAEIYRKTGRYDEATENCEKGLESEGEDMEIGRIKGILGAIYLRKGEMEKAMECYEDYLRIARDWGNLSEESNAYRAIGGAHFHRKEMDEAVNMWEKSMRTAEKAGDLTKKAYALINLGVAYRNMGRLEDAKRAQEEALDIARKTEDIYVQGQILNNLGTIYYMLGHFGQQVSAWEESLGIKKRIGDVVGAANIYNNLGVAYYEAKKYEKSREYLEKSLKIFENIGDSRGVAKELCNLVLPYSRLCREKMIDTLKRAENSVKSGEMEDMLPLLYRARIAVLAATGDFEGAEKEFNEHIDEVLDKYGDVEEWLHIKVDFSEILIEKGDLMNARKELEEIVEAAERYGIKRYRTIALDIMKKLNGR